MKWLSLANLQHAYARLAPRERMLVTAAAAVFVALLLVSTVYKLQSSKSAMRARIASKQQQLRQVEALRKEYFELKGQTDALTAKEPGRSPNWLYSTLEGLVTKSLPREKLSSMAPASKPIGEQYVEESVNVQLVAVTLQQTVALLHEIEQLPTPVHVARLQMKKRSADPYQFDLTFSASSIKTAS